MLGADLRMWRLDHGLTQAELADRLLIAVLTIKRWEGGTSGIPTFLRLALAELDRQLKEERRLEALEARW